MRGVPNKVTHESICFWVVLYSCLHYPNFLWFSKSFFFLSNCSSNWFCLICFHVKSAVLTGQNISFSVSGKPQSIESSERVQLSGTYNVRKGKLQLPVNRWTRRQVILCGTCLIVSSVKESQTGKMHILPLIGGKVCKSHTMTGRYCCHIIIFFSLSLPLLPWSFYGDVI